jgi:hypothetical protein
MTIEAKVVAHSSHPGCPDLFSVQLRYPRFIHAEVMTHRVFSRSASSSRAVPIWRMILSVLRDPAMPVSWGSNRPGMQAGADLTGWRLWIVRSIWMLGCYMAVALAWVAMMAGAHKQIVNRILEPWAHISVIVTATDWHNFFVLRIHPAADPTMRALAVAIRAAMDQSKADFVPSGHWHSPYAEDPQEGAAYCARVSYLNHDGTKPSRAANLKLAKLLRDQQHMSPFEHQAKPTPGYRHANLSGWKSQRVMIDG